MSELETAINDIESAVGVLRRSSCEGWLARLEQLLADVRAGNDFTRKQALLQIGEICHPKALGDVLVIGMDFQAWGAQLDSLYCSCGKAFNILDRQVG